MEVNIKYLFIYIYIHPLFLYVTQQTRRECLIDYGPVSKVYVLCESTGDLLKHKTVTFSTIPSLVGCPTDYWLRGGDRNRKLKWAVNKVILILNSCNYIPNSNYNLAWSGNQFILNNYVYVLYLSSGIKVS